MNLNTATRIQRIAKTIQATRWKEIFDAAGADTRRCTTELSDAARGQSGERRLDQFWARSSVRTFFAMVEALTFEMRLALRQVHAANIVPFDPAEATLVFEQSFDLDEAGRPQARPRFLALDRNFRFAFPRFASLFGVQAMLDVGGEGWRKFLQTIKVRNRITHPKSPSELDLSIEEVTVAMEAIAWYSETMTALFVAIERAVHEATSIVESPPPSS
jgi:hypothetical protein